jgi:hypothetical protein
MLDVVQHVDQVPGSPLAAYLPRLRNSRRGTATRSAA